MSRISPTWRVYLTLGVFTIGMLGAMGYVLTTGTRMSVQQTPLIDAAMEIRLEATSAHLWFEEILSGDSNESMDDVWPHLEAADWYARAMLEGGQNQEGTYVPLDDPELRAMIQQVRLKLAEFEEITRQRWSARQTSAAGTDIDQRYDQVFEEFALLADDVETSVQQSIARDIRVFRQVQISLIAGAALLAILVGVVLARYIREKEQSEERIRQNEEELRLTFESTPIAVAVLGEDSKIVRVNPACCELLGYTEEELRALRFDEITHPDDTELSGDLFGQLLRGEISVIHLEKRYVRKDGATLHGLIHARRIPGTSGNPPRLVGQIIDRTDQVAAEQEAHFHRERLAHVTRVSAMGEMATGIAHEINQPLTAIAAFAQACRRFIESGKTDSIDFLKALTQVDAQALRAGEIIRRLRSFISKRAAERDRVDINELVRDVVNLANADARPQRFSIDMSLAEDLPALDVDPVQIQQVILNLIRNGVDAMHGNDESDRIVHVETMLVGESVQISVTDRGAGIPEDVAARLFEPFFTTKKTGLGMGLSISRSIVASHRGDLWCEANSEGGSTFRFMLPTPQASQISPGAALDGAA